MGDILPSHHVRGLAFDVVDIANHSSSFARDTTDIAKSVAALTETIEKTRQSVDALVWMWGLSAGRNAVRLLTDDDD